MSVVDHVKALLNSVLQLGGRADSWNEQTALLGNVPELDSMSVVGIITALEDEFEFTIEDDEIDGDLFATLGSLTRFVEQKLAA
jgi:acyl carrier protein